MVRATNAGGEAQSIADLAVFEPKPETMVEMHKTVVYEDVQGKSIVQVINNLYWKSLFSAQYFTYFIFERNSVIYFRENVKEFNVYSIWDVIQWSWIYKYLWYYIALSPKQRKRRYHQVLLSWANQNRRRSSRVYCSSQLRRWPRLRSTPCERSTSQK